MIRNAGRSGPLNLAEIYRHLGPTEVRESQILDEGRHALRERSVGLLRALAPLSRLERLGLDFSSFSTSITTHLGACFRFDSEDNSEG